MSELHFIYTLRLCFRTSNLLQILDFNEELIENENMVLKL